MNADILDYLGEHYDAVIVEGFGIGGIPNTEVQMFKEKIADFLDKGKTLVITTQEPLEGSDLSVYEVGRVFKKDERVLEAYNMTLEAIVTKLMWALGCTSDKTALKELFYKEINFDIYQ